MAVQVSNFVNNDRMIVARLRTFSVLEHIKDPSVAAGNAMTEYFMSQMGVRRRQLVVDLNGENSLVTQTGAMQWMYGDIELTTGLKGVGDLLGKMVKGAVTKESAVKPEYVGVGRIVLEPTYKYILLQDVAGWGPGGMSIEDGTFLACEGTVQRRIAARTNISSAVAGGEGLFNLSLVGNGIVALESNVPPQELVVVDLDEDTLKLDGHFAVCWSTSLKFTVERSSKTLIGSAINKEGLVNVYRGTGRVLISPTATETATLYQTTHN